MHGVSSRSVQTYAGLMELAVLAGGEVAHIAISDGRVLGLKVYSILPGSKSKKKKIYYCDHKMPDCMETSGAFPKTSVSHLTDLLCNTFWENSVVLSKFHFESNTRNSFLSNVCSYPKFDLSTTIYTV